MPAVTSGKILVTGGSGYIGAWIVKLLVERNYSVVVAGRNQSQVDFITNRFPEYKGKVTSVVVPNIEAPGAYDEAVKDVDGIVHAASPVIFSWDDPSQVIDPAVKGAIGILTSAHKYGKNVKRVVLTSSKVAIVMENELEEDTDGKVYDETYWNTTSAKIVEKEGKNSSPSTVYAASKALAERAAWDFIEKEKPSFDLSVINPVYNFGPFIHEITKARGIGSSPGGFLRTLPAGDTSGKHSGDWVDVRDSAIHHVLALSTPEAGGERISSVADTFAWQDLYDILNDAGFKNIPGKETYGAGKNNNPPRQSNAKSLRIFPGFKYRTLSESVREMGENLVQAGLL